MDDMTHYKAVDTDGVDEQKIVIKNGQGWKNVVIGVLTSILVVLVPVLLVLPNHITRDEADSMLKQALDNAEIKHRQIVVDAKEMIENGLRNTPFAKAEPAMSQRLLNIEQRMAEMCVGVAKMNDTLNRVQTDIAVMKVDAKAETKRQMDREYTVQ